MIDKEKYFNIINKLSKDCDWSVEQQFIFPKNSNKESFLPKIDEILNINYDNLTDTAKNVIELLENKQEIKEAKDYNRFKNELLAYITIQDVFDAPLLKGTNEKNMFQQWYFYYEGKYILNELIYCWLNGFYVASTILSRLFVEFNLLQLYFFNVTRRDNNIENITMYFENNRTPKWSKLISKSLPKDSFCKPIKERIKSHLEMLSRNISHPYHPYMSRRQMGRMNSGPTIDGVFLWIHIGVILESILWAYYVNFPMLFHPVDILKKFGFNYPVGLFIDKNTAEFIKRSMQEEDYKEFYKYSLKQEQVTSLLEWYNGRASLSEKEIINTWDKQNGKLDNMEQGYCKSIVKLRVIKEAAALERRNIEEDKKYDSININELLKYKSWEKYMKR